MGQLLKYSRFHDILVGWGLRIVDWPKVYVEIFLKKDAVTLTDPRPMRVRDSDIKIPEKL